jgi:hypothetical protein
MFILYIKTFLMEYVDLLDKALQKSTITGIWYKLLQKTLFIARLKFIFRNIIMSKFSMRKMNRIFERLRNSR